MRWLWPTRRSVRRWLSNARSWNNCWIFTEYSQLRGEKDVKETDIHLNFLDHFFKSNRLHLSAGGERRQPEIRLRSQASWNPVNSGNHYMYCAIKDLLHDNGQFLTYEEFQRKYSCKTNFLNFYQVVSAIPYYLLSKARNLDDISKNFYAERSPLFQLLNGHEINLDKAKAKEFYWILNERNLTSLPTGPEKWKKNP